VRQSARTIKLIGGTRLVTEIMAFEGDTYPYPIAPPAL